MSAVPDLYRRDDMARRIALVAQSHLALTGRTLVGPGGCTVTALWEAQAVIVAHGTEADPLFFFANRAALDRFACPLAEFIGMPSRYSAETPLRDERQALLERVSRSGFIDDYAGVRIAATGQRFRIEQACVWNLIDSGRQVHGQAATFSRWTDLPA